MNKGTQHSEQVSRWLHREWISIALLSILVAIATVCLVRLNELKTSVSNSQTASDELRQVDQALATMSQEVSKLVGQLESQSKLQAPQPNDFRTSPDALSLSTVADSLRSVEASMRGLLDVSKSLTAEAQRLGNATGNLVAPPKESDPSRIDTLFSVSDEQRDSTHFFWTYQQVLNEYGYPNKVRAGSDGVLKWDYLNAKQGRIVFFFFDGRVTQVAKASQ